MPTTSQSKPLFKRHHLYWLIWIVAVAILLLSLTGEKPLKPLDYRYEQGQSLWRLSSKTFSDYQIQAFLPLPLALNFKGQLKRAQLQQNLQNQLESVQVQNALIEKQWQIDFQLQGAFALLNFTLSQAPIEKDWHWLSDFLDSLLLPLDEKEVERLKVLDYLQRGDLEKQLLQALSEWLAPITNSNDGWRVILAANKLKLSDEFVFSPITASRVPALLTADVKRQLSIDNPVQLIAFQIERPASSEQMAIQEMVLRVLKNRLDAMVNNTVSYRLIWQPLVNPHYIAIVLNYENQRAISSNEIENQLTRAVHADEVVLASSAIKDSFVQQHQSTSGQLAWLRLVSSLDFAIGSDVLFVKALEDASLAVVNDFYTQLWQESRLTVLLSPYNLDGDEQQ